MPKYERKLFPKTQAAKTLVRNVTQQNIIVRGEKIMSGNTRVEVSPTPPPRTGGASSILARLGPKVVVDQVKSDKDFYGKDGEGGEEEEEWEDVEGEEEDGEGEEGEVAVEDDEEEGEEDIEDEEDEEDEEEEGVEEGEVEYEEEEEAVEGNDGEEEEIYDGIESKYFFFNNYILL